MTHLPRREPVDTTTLMDSETINLDFTFYNVTSIQGFSTHINVVDYKYCMLFLFSTTNKYTTLCAIKFILEKLEREKHQFKIIRFDKYGTL